MILKHDNVFLAGELQITIMKSPIFKLQKRTKKVNLALYFLGESREGRALSNIVSGNAEC